MRLPTLVHGYAKKYKSNTYWKPHLTDDNDAVIDSLRRVSMHVLASCFCLIVKVFLFQSVLYHCQLNQNMVTDFDKSVTKGHKTVIIVSA